MHLVCDSNIYDKEEFGSSFDFLLSHGLIEVKEYLSQYKIVFVGEVLTPFDHFISLPKNFSNETEENAILVLDILREFKSLKRYDKLLIKNKSYQLGNEIESEFYYWKRIFSYFIDYITYEFYYPRKRTILHSLGKQCGKLNPMLTDLNRDRFGSGITYEVKDYRNDYFRNVFYSVLKSLEDQFASQIETNKIRELENYLKSKNIVFSKIDVNKAQFLNYARKLQTNAAHDVIVKTIVDYFMRSKITEKNSINVFYTREFEYLYQYLLQKVLDHNREYKNPYWIDPDFKTLHPDIFNEFFICDVKYCKLNDLNKKSFEKELYAYNVANGNIQSNFILIPAEETYHCLRLTHKDYTIKVVVVDLRDVLSDYHRNTRNILTYVKSLI